MLRAAKFEFYIVNRNMDYGRTNTSGPFEVIVGIQWGKVARELELICPFHSFDFDNSRFAALKKTAPQFLVKGDNGPRWDSDQKDIDSWDRLLNRSYSQLRNNIAHGNKAQLPAAFTHDRTIDFLKAGNALIDYIACTIFGDAGWETPIAFR